MPVLWQVILPGDLDRMPAFRNEGRARIADRTVGTTVAPNRGLELLPIGSDQTQPLLCLPDINDEGPPLCCVDHCRDRQAVDEFRLIRRIEQRDRRSDGGGGNLNASTKRDPGREIFVPIARHIPPPD